MKSTIIIAVMLTATGLWLRYHIGKRRFDRRGIGGLQQFTSYGRFIWTMVIEKVICLIATLCLLAGLFLLAITGFDHFKF